MKNRIRLILSLLLITSFLLSVVSYQSDRTTLLLAMIKTIESMFKNGIVMDGKFSLNFQSRTIEILVLVSFVLVTAVIKSWRANICGVLILLFYSFLLLYLYSSIMNAKLFIMTSIPFYIMAIILMVNNVHLIRRT